MAQALAPAAAPQAQAAASQQRAPSDAERAGAKPVWLLTQTGPNMRATTSLFEAVTGELGIAGGAQRGNGKPAAASKVMDAAAQDASGPDQMNYGSSGIASIWHYNDRLVQSYTVYPYRTYGKIYFQQTSGGGWFICSGAMISKSIVVTAGHCVHRGNGNNQRGNGYNATTYFYPAINEARNPDHIPYGYAQEANLYTTSGWFNNGSLNSTLGKGWDVGIIVLQKRIVGTTQTTEELGAITGWNNFCYTNCLQSYWGLSQYGYPGNYYSAQQMTESQHLASEGSRWNSFASGDYVAGSGMEGGSSGGPSVSNPGTIVDSAANKGSYTLRNVIFAVTSWGYSGQAVKVQGYSPLSGPSNVNNFKGMFNNACNFARTLHGTATCTPLI